MNDVDYVIETPDRKKSQRLCHINMLKEYYGKTNSLSNVMAQPAPVAACMVYTSKDKEVKEDILDTAI